jgi:FtsH-binding integral membrane protein
MIRLINILYELFGFTVVLVLLILTNKAGFFQREVMQKVWDYGLAISFFAFIISVTKRALSESPKKRFASVFAFGFFAGAIVWTLYSVVEAKGIVITLNIFYIVIGIMSFGFIAGLAATLLSYLVYIFLKPRARDTK